MRGCNSLQLLSAGSHCIGCWDFGVGITGAIIDYIPASTKNYVGSPGIAIMPDGSYVASHDYFGPAVPAIPPLFSVPLTADKPGPNLPPSKANGGPRFFSTMANYI